MCPEKINKDRWIMHRMRLIWLAGAMLVAGPVAAAAADYVQVRVTNPSEQKWNVEVRDMICEGKVLWRGKMAPGQEKKLRICTGEDGSGIIRTMVAGGCASAKATVHDGLAKGAEISVSPIEPIEE